MAKILLLFVMVLVVFGVAVAALSSADGVIRESKVKSFLEQILTPTQVQEIEYLRATKDPVVFLIEVAKRGPQQPTIASEGAVAEQSGKKEVEGVVDDVKAEEIEDVSEEEPEVNDFIAVVDATDVVA